MWKLILIALVYWIASSGMTAYLIYREMKK